MELLNLDDDMPERDLLAHDFYLEHEFFAVIAECRIYGNALYGEKVSKMLASNYEGSHYQREQIEREQSMLRKGRRD